MKMADVYLSCDEPNLEFAEALKKEIESRCNLVVALEKDDSWEEDSGNCRLLEHLNQAKLLVAVSTEHSNITAWIMDQQQQQIGLTAQQALAQRLHFQRFCKPPTVDFSKSYKEGLREFMDLLRQNTGSRRFRKPNKLSSFFMNQMITKRANKSVNIVRRVRAR